MQKNIEVSCDFFRRCSFTFTGNTNMSKNNDNKKYLILYFKYFIVFLSRFQFLSTGGAALMCIWNPTQTKKRRRK